MSYRQCFLEASCAPPTLLPCHSITRDCGRFLSAGQCVRTHAGTPAALAEVQSELCNQRLISQAAQLANQSVQQEARAARVFLLRVSRSQLAERRRPREHAEREAGSPGRRARQEDGRAVGGWCLRRRCSGGAGE